MKRSVKHTLLISLLLVLCHLANAAQVDTLSIVSPRMNKKLRTVVILPDDYKKNTALPVLYLLHGYAGRHDWWLKTVPQLRELVDLYHYIVVCPDGGYDSWYWDVEGQPANQYETFISDELIKEIDGLYATRKDRGGRAIAGMSMGGHGALSLAFKHQDKYGAAGSIAGAVDLLPIPNLANIKGRIGIQSENPEEWKKRSVIELTHLLTPGANLKLFIDCGYSDFLYPANIKLHEKLQYLNIEHHFLTMPGKHDGEYATRSLPFQMAFFYQFFYKVV